MNPGDSMLWVQPAPSDVSPATRPSSPTDFSAAGAAAVFEEFARRLANLENQVVLSVPSDRVMSKIVLSQEAILIQSDKIGLLGEVTFADWHRDITGVATGGVDPSITQIRGGTIRTERILSFDGQSFLDLDAVGSQPFLKLRTAGSLNADGTFRLGGTGSKSLEWNGTNLLIDGQALIAGTPAVDVVIDAATGAAGVYTVAKLQADLTAGVSKILAGVGSDYRLNVDTTNALITLAHKDAVYKGSAVAGGGIRPALGISAAGLAMGYSDNAGAWHDAVSIDAAGNAVFAGSLSAATGTFSGALSGATGTFAGSLSAATGTFGTLTTTSGGHIKGGQTAYNTGTGFFLGDVGGVYKFSVGNGASRSVTFDGTNLSIGGQVLIAGTDGDTVVGNAYYGATRSVGDLTETVLSNSGTAITMTSSQLFRSGSGLAGVFIGAGGISGKNSLGQATFAIDGSTGAATFSGSLSAATGTFAGALSGATGTFSGALSGASGTFAGDIVTEGKGVFRGNQTTGGITAAVIANDTLSSLYGLVAKASGIFSSAVNGQATDNARGVTGSSDTGTGVYGFTNTAGYAVLGIADGGAATGGRFSNNGGGVALSVQGLMTINNATLVSNLNANYVEGVPLSGLCRRNQTDVEYSVDGGVTWALVRFR